MREVNVAASHTETLHLAPKNRTSEQMHTLPYYTRIVSDCGITQKGCAVLISALRSNPSHLRELNLSCNEPGDSGVKLLSALLEDPHCKLEKLQLWDCSIGEEGCAALISALRSNPSHLRELDLSCNKPGDSGVNLISALLEDPHCKLEKLV
ncbi:ribonuclease inhibitor [Labeo rohita]|uniref:ribonuclease inhibitor n=1 Tax=Labeo rohita TaxID=84645 RepID=UPI0021E283F0|nr:ribonuclease inhibitor [Labeo rohita]